MYMCIYISFICLSLPLSHVYIVLLYEYKRIDYHSGSKRRIPCMWIVVARLSLSCRLSVLYTKSGTAATI